MVSVSPGAIGGFGANHHLRQSLVAVGMPVLVHPEVYVSQAGTLFADDGSLVSEDTRNLFQTFMASFAAWIEVILR